MTVECARTGGSMVPVEALIDFIRVAVIGYTTIGLVMSALRR